MTFNVKKLPEIAKNGKYNYKAMMKTIGKQAAGWALVGAVLEIGTQLINGKKESRQ